METMSHLSKEVNFRAWPDYGRKICPAGAKVNAEASRRRAELGKITQNGNMADFIFGVLLDNICRGMFRMVALNTMPNAAREAVSRVAGAARQGHNECRI
jgi:hypothetical protein